MSHSTKLFERTIEKRLKRRVNISESQSALMKMKLSTDAIFALRQLQEKYREGHKELHGVFIASTWRGPMTECHGRSCIGACERRTSRRSTSALSKT